MKYINADNLYDFAFLNEDTLVYPIKKLCVSFHGYTDGTMFEKSPQEAKMLGEQGIAWVFPYYSVWAWMSKSSCEFVEQVLDAVYERLHLSDDIPFVVSGGSMGGLTALNYLVYGKRKAMACALNCPATDMYRGFHDRVRMRRAILSAHILEDGDLDDITKKYSPYYFADRLPNIPYLFIYGSRDIYFTGTQMPRMKEKLDEYALNYTLTVHEGMDHCDLAGNPKAMDQYLNFIVTV